MSDVRVEEASKSAQIKAKLKHEMREGLIIVSYLAVFLFAFSTYKMMLLHQFRSALEVYGGALLQASILTKVIMIGQALKVGKKWEHKPLLHVAVFKAVAFAVLVGVFEVVEEVLSGLFHGESLIGTFHEIGGWGALEIVVRGIVSFCVFIPFFALMETRRVMGEEPFEHLFLKRTA